MFKNEVGDIIGIIFVNTTCQSLPFKPNKANIDINHNMRRQVSKETLHFYETWSGAIETRDFTSQ